MKKCFHLISIHRKNPIRLLILTVIIILFSTCAVNSELFPERDFRDDMRKFVQSISLYAKSYNPDFVIIPQNGHELLTHNGEEDGEEVQFYIDVIDGIGRESLFYGDPGINNKTPKNTTNYMLPFMRIAGSNKIQVFVTDYCFSSSKIDDSIKKNRNSSFISFVADHRALDNIPEYPREPNNINNLNISLLSEVSNFLYIINPEGFNSKIDMLKNINNTDYDMIIVDLFDNDGISLTKEDVSSLKIKANGAARIVVAYMSIGEAEDYRYYWQPDWKNQRPEWMEKENPDWPGNYKVRYWKMGWREIIYGNDNGYLDKILNAGFDGVYLDIIDGFEYFES